MARRALTLLVASVALAGCSDAGGDRSGGPGPTSCEGGPSYSSTFEGIQQTIFERHGCTAAACHGDAGSGGLRLTRETAYANLIEVASSVSPLPRVLPGDRNRSFLYAKLAAATDPSSADITGAAMPLGQAPLSTTELELVRLWINGGAPQTGTVPGTEALLGACLPPVKPITIKPLDAPPPGEGFQFRLAPWQVPPQGEGEVCFATWYDLTGQVPAEALDPTGQYVRLEGQEMRQDPGSHHLVLNYSGVPASDLHHPSLGEWACRGGAHDGESCQPLDLAACGSEGVCATTPQRTIGCLGYGPPSGLGLVWNYQIGGAQQAQAQLTFPDGVFSQMPIRGLIYWNSHAFNLTDEPHRMQGRINFRYARRQEHPIRPLLEVSKVFSPNNPPFTTAEICGTSTLPQGAKLFGLTSHNHKHCKLFTAFLPDGREVYRSTTYNDPTKLRFDPPLSFDSPDPAERTLRYCGVFNNGVKEDGSPDPEAVTRWSRVPESARATFGSCRPVACAEGQVGAPCDGPDDHATCDSAPGLADGLCDACPITGGESTENEMFILIGQYYLETDGPDSSVRPGGIASAEQESAHDARGRSTFSGIALPPAMGCTMGAADHASHAMQAARAR